MKTMLLFFVVIACSAKFAFGADSIGTPFNPNVATTNVQTPNNALSDPDRADPLQLMASAAMQFERGEKDRAVFWFYAGQLRARYQLTGENRQLISVALMTMGDKINAHAMRDVTKMIGMFNEVLEWDVSSFDSWAKANRFNPLDVELLKRRTEARNGLMKFADELNSKRAEYEKKAKDYKDPSQMTETEHERALQSVRKAAQNKAMKDLSLGPLVRTIGEYKLTIPSNYMLQERESSSFPNTLRFSYFLPDFEGWTHSRVELWVDATGQFVEAKEHATANLWLSANVSHERAIKNVLAIGLPTTKVWGMEAYVNDFHLTGNKLPVNYSKYSPTSHYLFVGNGKQQEHQYMICRTLNPEIKHHPFCNVIIADEQTGFLIQTLIHEDYAPEWKRIGSSLNKLVNSWRE